MRVMHIADFGRDDLALSSLFARICSAFHDPIWRDEVGQQVVIRHNALPVEHLEVLGLNLERLPFRRWLDFSTSSRISERLQIVHPDVVLVWRPEAMGSLRLESHRCLVGVVSNYGSIAPWRSCHRLIALNEDLGDAVLEQGWPEDLLDLPAMPVLNEIGQAFPRKALNTPSAADLLVSTPLTKGDSGSMHLIRALADMKDAFLWLIAPRRDHRKLEALASRHETVSRLRLLEPGLDNRALYAAADVVVAAGTNDNLGYGVVEAWSQSRPVVGTGGMGPAGLIRHGDSGMLSPAGDARALARTLKRVLRDPMLYDRLAAGGRRVYEAHHQENLALEHWMACFYRAQGQAVPVGSTGRTSEEPGGHADITA
ncbi:glycosyltransferase [Fodinicurvata halophila]|uniref:Glycosyltransferase n=1 Tax=Fodinicurvata halophila TaxID=1419723 RepID=A0ABV8UJ79_9PROT